MKNYPSINLDLKYTKTKNLNCATVKKKYNLNVQRFSFTLKHNYYSLVYMLK